MSKEETPLHVVTGKSQTMTIRITFTDAVQTPISYLSKGNYPLQTSSPKVTFPLKLNEANFIAPQSPQEKLERFFDQRPSPTELKQRNILKDSKLAPSLQSAQVGSPRSQLT
jgi:hypothetical protein